MSTILEVSHATVYRYRRPVRFGEHRAMFRPRDSHDLRILDTALRVRPLGAVRWLHDVFSNSISVITFDEREAEELRLESRIRVAHYGLAKPDRVLADRGGGAVDAFPFAYDADDVADLGRAREPHYPDPDGAVAAWAWGFAAGASRTLELLTAMTASVRRDFAYETRDEHGTRPPAETLARRSGSCRDLALLMMEAARRLGFGARFVSGYLYDPALDDGRAAGDGTRGAGATHAWAQIYLPAAGWVEFDPTNGIVGGRNLIRVAVARDPRQAVPVAGSYFGAPDDFLGLSVEVQVRRCPPRTD